MNKLIVNVGLVAANAEMQVDLGVLLADNAALVQIVTVYPGSSTSQPGSPDGVGYVFVPTNDVCCEGVGTLTGASTSTAFIKNATTLDINNVVLFVVF